MDNMGILVISQIMCGVVYLGIQEGSEDSNGSSKSVNGLDRGAEDNDGGDDDWDTLHGVTDTKRQGRDLV